MEKKYKIYSLETNSALYGIVHQGEREMPRPNVVCEIDLGWQKTNSFDSEDSAMQFIKDNQKDLQGDTLVILPTINVPYH